eukprot:CAMPEP_0177662060 /NCGR_PEP_ID=MMETSP0447-20121125/19062_1 /TAXON_ID=0 /ORGANISM="Stygamoeba regulata, Strain BSH-02190019" /LENGTH=421 /DNA_ID=CAMNT_0019167547 /DNA_START=114 /DNA_END=1379 /DNA_ORIENTATION=-
MTKAVVVLLGLVLAVLAAPEIHHVKVSQNSVEVQFSEDPNSDWNWVYHGRYNSLNVAQYDGSWVPGNCGQDCRVSFQDLKLGVHWLFAVSYNRAANTFGDWSLPGTFYVTPPSPAPLFLPPPPPSRTQPSPMPSPAASASSAPPASASSAPPAESPSQTPALPSASAAPETPQPPGPEPSPSPSPETPDVCKIPGRELKTNVAVQVATDVELLNSTACGMRGFYGNMDASLLAQIPWDWRKDDDMFNKRPCGMCILVTGESGQQVVLEVAHFNKGEDVLRVHPEAAQRLGKSATAVHTVSCPHSKAETIKVRFPNGIKIVGTQLVGVTQEEVQVQVLHQYLPVDSLQINYVKMHYRGHLGVYEATSLVPFQAGQREFQLYSKSVQDDKLYPNLPIRAYSPDEVVDTGVNYPVQRREGQCDA